MELKNQHKLHGGELSFYQHQSAVNKSQMGFAIYLPPQVRTEKVPVLYFLSGLTCTEENFMIKSGAQRFAAEYGLALVTMDTSPRDLGIDGEDETYDFGSGAGFYLNATAQPWAENYQMYDYVTQELPALIEKHFPVCSERRSIFGHSMGGHGALTIALKNPDSYQSVSAFSPIVAPSQNPWGQKAFKGYLGDDTSQWSQYDTVELIKTCQHKLPLFIDQGSDDEFLAEYLQPEKLQAVCAEHKHPLNMRLQTGYDHSYYFISSFIQDHIKYHAEALNS
ncbi:S-formylglutathione hydrolase [Marinicella sp. S1101]|uniref:S-formylglutathione hydrolase n=1 Tax=Marinicella marina TaxID=2996016 RepID=UPI002260BDC6|nr:S-formylglutathione hydrolase [Marinicella marina]MCX7555145.1 S-formylglutathione hydrolase [Marinicella marina]MDJ1141414.1 S-formylglutathione hydrolase [Marinicella marina]